MCDLNEHFIQFEISHAKKLNSCFYVLDLVHNALIKDLLGNDCGIRVTNQPFAFKPDDNVDRTYTDNFGSVFPYVLAIMMLVYSAQYVAFLIKVCIHRCHKIR